MIHAFTCEFDQALHTQQRTQYYSEKSSLLAAVEDLLKVLSQLRRAPRHSAKREVYEDFLLHAQNDAPVELMPKLASAGSPELLLGIVQQTPPGPNDRIWLGKGRGALELLLASILKEFSALDGAKRHGRPARDRTQFFFEMSAIFNSAGHELRANYRDGSGKIEGSYIQFLKILIDAVPPNFRKFLLLGLPHAAREHVRLVRERGLMQCRRHGNDDDIVEKLRANNYQPLDESVTRLFQDSPMLRFLQRFSKQANY